MAFHNWFIPHRDTHQKAKLISWEAILIYILLFILLQVGFSIVSYSKPGILGIAGNIDQKKLIELTNQERQKANLPLVTENEALDKAANLKAENMFSENYWAHFAPSGKTPWDFILGAGYKFSFAGENLAKNFYSSEDVVSAWMASQTHKDNLLNGKYKDIGIAVVNGVLNGQETTLVVQMFGTTSQIFVAQKPTQIQKTPTPVTPQPTTLPQPQVLVEGKQITVPKNKYESAPTLVASITQASSPKSIVDPYKVYKTASLSVVLVMSSLLLIDLWVLKKRGVFRITSHHIAHMSLLALTFATLVTTKPGSIL